MCVCVYTCICVYVYMSLFLHVYTYPRSPVIYIMGYSSWARRYFAHCLQPRDLLYKGTALPEYVYIYICIHTHLYVYIYIYIYSCTYRYMYIHREKETETERERGARLRRASEDASLTSVVCLPIGP